MRRKTSSTSHSQNSAWHCRDCAHSYDWNSPALDGHLILCRCPYMKEGGKYCIFLSDPACERFAKRIQC